MKKTLRIISLLLILTVVLCACGSKEENTAFSHSKPYDENGYWKDLKASEYVELPDMSTVKINKADMDEQIAMLVNPTVGLDVALGATVVLIVAGTLAGLFPARKASRVRPIEALRAE